MLSTLPAEKDTICELIFSPNCSRYDATPLSTSEFTVDPATGVMLAGTSVMSMTPAFCAAASARSSMESLSPTLMEAGSIHTLPSPRYQTTSPALITTSALTLRSLTTILTVSGYLRSYVTDPTHGFFLRLRVTLSSSKFRRVEPLGTFASFAMLARLMCFVAVVSTFVMVNAGVYESTR